ncbi:MAG: 4'-phosphopantetheinyl transferase superfamily protein [Spirochaetia bacterium]|jgi:4'-phosphopantetheinyl transferase
MSTGDEPWALPPRQPLLEPGSLHIWRASLDLPAAARGRLERVLSTSEREQCSRFVRPGDRARCAEARASLRVVLAQYTGEDPRVLPITVEASGKPSLDRSAGIQFNISHTRDFALIAVTRGLRVGIDIERVREVRDMEAILDGFFSEQEKAHLRSRAAEERIRTFFLLWTRREAAAKAVGLGLFDSFARFTLSPSELDRSGFIVALPQPDAPTGATAVWWMRDLLPAPGCAGAVCIEQRNVDPSFWRFVPQ